MDFSKLSNLQYKKDILGQNNSSGNLNFSSVNSIVGIVDNTSTSIKALVLPESKGAFVGEYINSDNSKGIQSNSRSYDNENIAFLFDINRETKVNLSSDITDHYTEDNSAIQDHIALKPIIIELSGIVGEYTYRDMYDASLDYTTEDSQSIWKTIDSANNRMGSLTDFTPNIVNQARDLYNTAKSTYATVNRLYNYFKKDSTNTKQEKEELGKEEKQNKVYQYFKDCWANRNSFKIVTPFGTFDNMYILEFNITQTEKTRDFSTISIKFKEITNAEILTPEPKTADSLNIQQNQQEAITEQAILGHDISVTKNNKGVNVLDTQHTIKTSNSTATFNCEDLNVSKALEKNNLNLNTKLLDTNDMIINEGNLIFK